jgi:hypothetical protein
MIAMILLAALSACSSPVTPRPSNVTRPGAQPTGSQDGLSDEMHKLADRMCICKDDVCAEKVSAVFRPWMEDHARATTTGNEASDAEVARYTRAFDRYTACLTKLSSNP